MVEAIHRNCRTESGGFTTVEDVNQVVDQNLKSSKGEESGIQQPDLLSGTLKYLFLIFTDDQVLPLDRWEWNEAGHPLPVG